jgi:glucokinase
MRGGIDLGGTKIEAAIVDGDGGKIVAQARRATPIDGGPPKVVEELAAAIREAAAQAGVETGELAGVGVGSPGSIDSRRGTVALARNLPDWEQPFALAPALSDALGTQVRIGNDVEVAVAGEFRLGAGQPYSSLLGVWWGTGVGGGLVLRRKVWRGRGAAGEIGHMVIRRGGARCGCGRRGCMEAYAGRANMEAKARAEVKRGRKTDLFEIMEKRGRTRLTSGVWERALDRGDKLATELIDRAVEALGTGVASAVNLLDVEAVVLGGGLGTRLGPRYLDALREEMGKHLFVSDRPPALELSALGDLGGAIGAALLVSG